MEKSFGSIKLGNLNKENMDWSVVLTFTYPQEAYMAKNYLESEGIETFIQDELTAQSGMYANAIGGVKLLIPTDKLEQGIEILKEGGYICPADLYREEEIKIVKWEKGMDKTCCPFCGSTNIGKKKDPDKIMVYILLILSVLFPIFRSSYKCFDCQKVWKYKK